MKLIITTLTMIVISFSSMAENFYIGITAGQTDVDTGITEIVGSTLDEDGNGNSFFIGKKIIGDISLEGFYTDLGKVSLSGNSGDTFVYNNSTLQFNTTATLEAVSTTYGIAGKIDVVNNEKANLFFKAGYHSWETEFKVAAGTTSASITTDGTDIMYGLGAEYRLNDQFSFIGGYDNYTLSDEEITYLYAGVKLSIN